MHPKITYTMKQIIYIIIILLLFSFSCSSGISDTIKVEVKEYRIDLNESELANIYKNYKEDIYIPITISNGKNKVKAKMRIKGDTSREYDKKSLKIVFNKDSLLDGEPEKINLNSEFTDKSYIRQFISSNLFKLAGIPTFKTNYAKVYFNNKFYGLYLQVENIGKDFLKNNGLDKHGNLYKAEKDGASLSMFEFKNPEEKWAKKTNKKDSSLSDLKELIYDISNVSDFEFYSFLKQTFEYDKLITLVSMNMLIQNGSTYYHNYYLFHDINGNGKWQILPWDLDKSMNYYSWKPYKYHETSSNWESDNPLIERMFLNTNVVNDIKKEILKLEETIFNSETLNPVINEIEKQIEEYVKLDERDKIKSVDEWKKMIKAEKDFIPKQAENIVNQLNKLPKSFVLLNQNKKYTKSPKLYWSASKSPKKITYKLLYGKHFLLEDATTTKIENITDTFFQITKILPKGKYYWRVYASDGENTVEGFNTKCTFEIVEKTNIISEIKENTTLYKTDNPYFIVANLTIPKNITLTVNAGVELIFAKNATLFVNGNIKMKGEKFNPILLTPEETEWESISIDSEKGECIFENVIFNNGVLRSKKANLILENVVFNAQLKTLVFGEERQSLIWLNYGTFSMKNSYVYGSGKGEGLNINYAQTIIENSYFEQIPDAIELMSINKGLVQNNIIVYSPDDAIDMNGCSNILIQYNLLKNNKDKAVSIGTEQYGPSTNITVQHNLIVHNNYGISIKDSSFANSLNNIFIENNIDLDAHLKNNWKKYKIGGNLYNDSCIFINTIKQIKTTDEKSSIKITNSVSNFKNIEGNNNKLAKNYNYKAFINNKLGDIKFKNFNILDFYN